MYNQIILIGKISIIIENIGSSPILVKHHFQFSKPIFDVGVDLNYF